MKLFTQLAMVLLSVTAIGFSARAVDPPALHGMVVYGDEAVYLSHLPMFHSPHNYQVILKVSFDPGADSVYKKDQGSGLYTLAPEPFILPEKAKAGASFTGALFKGHFEQGGEFISEVEVFIEEVIYFEKLATGH